MLTPSHNHKTVEQSFQVQVPVTAKQDVVVMSDDNTNRVWLLIKNEGQDLIWLGYGQTNDARNNGSSLAGGAHIVWQYPANTPQGRITARLDTGAGDGGTLSIIVIRVE